MAISMSRTNLGSNHSVACIMILDHVFGLDRLGEARPARTTLKFVSGSKQRLARDNVHINPRFFIVTVGVIKRPLRPATLRNTVLLWRKIGNRVLVLVVVVRHKSNPSCGPP